MFNNNLIQRYMTLKNILFIIMIILTIIAMTKFQDIFVMLFATFVIACSLNPIVDILEKKISRKKAAGIVLGAFITILISITAPIFFLLGKEIKNFTTNLPTHFNNLYNFILASPFYNKIETLQLDWKELFSNASSYTSNIFNDVINFGINIGSALIYLIISVIIVYYLMADKRLIKDTYLKFFPQKMRKKADEIETMISKKIGGYIIALFITVMSVGLTMIIGLSIFHVNYAILLSLITTVLDIIPVVGPAIALLICLICTFESGWGTVAAVLGVFAIAQIIENNFVRPHVFGKFMDIHPILIYIFLFVTAKAIGPVGVIFAPAIAATVCVLIEEIYMRNVE